MGSVQRSLTEKPAIPAAGRCLCSTARRKLEHNELVALHGVTEKANPQHNAIDNDLNVAWMRLHDESKRFLVWNLSACLFEGLCQLRWGVRREQLPIVFVEGNGLKEVFFAMEISPRRLKALPSRQAARAAIAGEAQDVFVPLSHLDNGRSFGWLQKKESVVPLSLKLHVNGDGVV